MIRTVVGGSREEDSFFLVLTKQGSMEISSGMQIPILMGGGVFAGIQTSHGAKSNIYNESWIQQGKNQYIHVEVGKLFRNYR